MILGSLNPRIFASDKNPPTASMDDSGILGFED